MNYNQVFICWPALFRVNRRIPSVVHLVDVDVTELVGLEDAHDQADSSSRLSCRTSSRSLRFLVATQVPQLGLLPESFLHVGQW